MQRVDLLYLQFFLLTDWLDLPSNFVALFITHQVYVFTSNLVHIIVSEIWGKLKRREIRISIIHQTRNYAPNVTKK